MPQSALSVVYIHIVFSTKERRPFLRDPMIRERGFEWQGGYADFSVSQSNLGTVKEYIAHQEEHHRKMTFQDELRTLLRKHQTEWDERYVWD